MAQMMDAQNRSVTARVVSEIANTEGVDVYDVPALFDSVDPDALESLVADADASAHLAIEFDHAGYRIRIDGGRVSITSLGDEP